MQYESYILLLVSVFNLEETLVRLFGLAEIIIFSPLFSLNHWFGVGESTISENFINEIVKR
jgi:hypothetical protein